MFKSWECFFNDVSIHFIFFVPHLEFKHFSIKACEVGISPNSANASAFSVITFPTT